MERLASLVLSYLRLQMLELTVMATDSLRRIHADLRLSTKQLR